VPTYQYKCKACDNRFETVQKITDEPLTVCPECGGEIRRVLFPAGVVFKGSGWYVTDYRNGSEKAKYEAETKSETAPASKPAETKTETKPAETKTESKPAETASKAA
jgi:putative FmdB family regulatory protein